MVPIHTQAPKRGGIKEINLSKAFVHGLGTLAVDLQRKGETSSHVKVEDLGWSSLSEKKAENVLYFKNHYQIPACRIWQNEAWKGNIQDKEKDCKQKLIGETITHSSKDVLGESRLVLRNGIYRPCLWELTYHLCNLFILWWLSSCSWLLLDLLLLQNQIIWKSESFLKMRC